MLGTRTVARRQRVAESSDALAARSASDGATASDALGERRRGGSYALGE
jgi:hypothetical protein